MNNKETRDPSREQLAFPEFKTRDGESANDTNKRMNEFFNEILEKYKGKIDQTIDLGDGQWKQYGYGEGSTVRIHGNLNSGLYFDFSIKGSQWDSQKQVTSPIEGITITQTSYSSADSGYSFSVGPISLQTALTLWNATTSQMAS